MLLAQISRHSRYFGLTEETQAFVYAAGYQVLQELDNDELAALQSWLAQWVDDMQTGCDWRHAPPAR